MSGGRSSLWRVVLIVEDDSDGQALKRLAEASGLSIDVDWLPANGIGNIKRRGEALLRLARARVDSKRGCVAVIVDRDRRDHRRDEPHRTIRRVCARHGTPYIEAVEAMEAWFLADPGIIAWLGLGERTETDRVSDPKRVVERAFHGKTKRPYGRRRARVQLVANATGVQPTRSRSWSKAVEELRRCPGGRAPRSRRGQVSEESAGV